MSADEQHAESNPSPSEIPADVEGLEFLGPDSAPDDSTPAQLEPAEPPLPPAQRWLESLRRNPGPGLLEAALWIIAFFVLQIVMAIPTVLVLLSLQPAGAGPQRLDARLQQLLEEQAAIFLGVPMFLTYCVLIPLGWYRQSPRTDLKLNFSAPTLAQLLVSLSIVVPLGFIADFLFINSEVWMERAAGDLLKGMRDGTDIREALSKMKGAALPVLLFVIAVIPAVGEEFLFRGLIGRGLINRYGLIFGVGVTSILFALVHLYPPHVLAILPIGVVIHWVYLTSRSYWLPMLLHFANNAIATLAMTFSEEGDVVQETSLLVVLISAAYVIGAMAVLWQLRVRYIDPQLAPEGSHHPQPEPLLATDDITEDTLPGTPVPVLGAEAPPPKFGFQRTCPAGNFSFVASAVAAVVLLAELAMLVQAFS
jgi:membrane protease YdiL (CAAX protease family)